VKGRPTVFDALALSVVIAAFGLDFASKIWARQNLIPGTTVPFLPPLLKLTIDTNTGAAFSMGNNQGYLVGALATVIFIVICVWFFKRMQIGFDSNLERFGVAILLGGALGNLCDRYMYGRVTDFLDFMFMDFPIFNLADVLIDIGVGLIIISNMVRNSKESN
jgi:signal peptidase II